MKLDHDCIRDLLLYLEDHTGIYKDTIIECDNKFKLFEVSTAQICEEQIFEEKYQPDEIIYTLLKLREAGLIVAKINDMGGGSFFHFRVTDITWQGHEFLGNIRDDTTWNRVKTKSKELGISSVKGLATIAWQLFLASIQSPGSLQNVAQTFQNTI